MPLKFANTVIPERVRWLWPGYIPFGKVTMLDGDPGLGKSTILIDLAAPISTGGELPNGKRHKPMGTILLMGEDGAGDTIVPRLINAGADLAMVGIQDGYLNDQGQVIPASFPSDIPNLKEDIITASAGLVVIDPVMSYLDPDINSNNDQQVRRALMPLAELAEKTGAAIVLLRHLNKASSTSALYRGGGSIGFVGVARSGLIVARDPDAPERVVLASTKSNLGPPPPSLNYRLVGCENGAARVEWEGHSTHTAESLVQRPENDSERTAHDDAVSFLRELLVPGVPMASKEVWRQANEAGQARNTVLRAKNTLGVEVVKVRTLDGAWTWTLPRAVETDAEKEESAEGGPLNTSNSSDSLNSSDSSHYNQKNLISLKSLKNPIAEGQDSSHALFDAPESIPRADFNGPGYECAVCGAEIGYAMKGKPLLCSVHKDLLILRQLAAD
jgi:hypothetical protein